MRPGGIHALFYHGGDVSFSHREIMALEALVARAFMGDPRAFEVRGLHLLGACVHANRPDLATSLLERGFPRDAINPGYCTTALSEAVDLCSADFVRLLLAFRANPNGYVTEDASPLHIAARRGFVEIVEVLLRAGANPLIQDIAWRTPEQVAGSTEVVSVLRAFPGRPHTYGCPIGSYSE